MALELNPQQQATMDWCLNGSGSLNLIARAGTGKTSTILEIAKALSQRKAGWIYLGAFNKAIAEEIKSRLGNLPYVDASTMHSLGFNQWRKLRVVPRSEVEGKKLIFLAKNLGMFPFDKTAASALRDAVSYAKQSGFGLKGVCGVDACDDTAKAWTGLLDYYDLWDEFASVSAERIINCCITLYRASLDMCAEQGMIDFDDMILAPLYFGEDQISKTYDWVMLDECLVGDTPVLMPGNKLRTIKDLVDSEYCGNVLSYDINSNQTVEARVTGTHKIPLAKRMVRVVTRRRGYRLDGKRLSAIAEYVRYGTRALVCTEDHLVWAGGCWKPAGELIPGDRLIQESHAPKDKGFQNRYKIGAGGRERLASMMGEKNSSGQCGSSRGQGRIVKRGGNGRGLTMHQQALLSRLGSEWRAEYVISTGPVRKLLGLPTSYKVDLANVREMIAIELDGNSHQAAERKQQDAKKDRFLESKGWTVLRMGNRESISLTAELIMEKARNSPVECEVLSVETFTPSDPFVYDIDVEGTHNFYANGMVVHNCQDTNLVRRRLARAVLKPNGRFIGVGDPKQSIYGFAGSTNEAMDIIKKEFSCSELPLSVTYRCPKTVVALANTWVPDITAHESAPEGKVTHIDAETKVENLRDFWLTKFTPDDVILCRNTRPLLGIAKRLRAKGVPCVVEGNHGRAIIALASKWGEDITIGTMLHYLGTHEAEQVTKWTAKNREEKAEDVREKCAMLRDMVEDFDHAAVVRDFTKYLENMFGFRQDDRPILRLCSIHRSKGREWRRVFLIGRNRYMPSRYAKQAWEIQQEDNLAYVAVTRAKWELVEVSVPPQPKQGEPEWWEV